MAGVALERSEFVEELLDRLLLVLVVGDAGVRYGWLRVRMERVWVELSS